jgi:hypothetical protein
MARLIAKIIVRMCWQSSLNEAEQFEPRNVETNFLSIPNVTSRLNNFYFIGKNHFFLVIDANKWPPLPWMFRNTKKPLCLHRSYAVPLCVNEFIVPPLHH